METEKLNSIIKNNPNSLYSLLAASRHTKEHRTKLENKRLGKYGKLLYDYKPKDEFIADKVAREVYNEARNNINKREYELKNKRYSLN